MNGPENITIGILGATSGTGTTGRKDFVFPCSVLASLATKGYMLDGLMQQCVNVSHNEVQASKRLNGSKQHGTYQNNLPKCELLSCSCTFAPAALQGAPWGPGFLT